MGKKKKDFKDGSSGDLDERVRGRWRRMAKNASKEIRNGRRRGGRKEEEEDGEGREGTGNGNGGEGKEDGRENDSKQERMKY